jgi:hypothetical protein
VPENSRGLPSQEDEVSRALNAAADSYRLHPGDDERATRAASAAVGWTLARARWCLEVNRERLQAMLSDPEGGG